MGYHRFFPFPEHAYRSGQTSNMSSAGRGAERYQFTRRTLKIKPPTPYTKTTSYDISLSPMVDEPLIWSYDWPGEKGQ